MMKILAISDLHGEIHPGLNDYLQHNKVDLIVICGDITHFGPSELAQDLLNEICAYKIPVVAVPGNCDPQDINSCLQNCQAINVHGKKVDIQNMGICGLGGSNPTPFNTPIEFGELEIYEELDKLMLGMKDEKVKILITHAPPYKTQVDKISSGDHVGSKSIREIIQKYKPDLNICGHVHESQAIDKLEDTVIVNPGQLTDGYACLITIEEENEEHPIQCEIINLD